MSLVHVFGMKCLNSMDLGSCFVLQGWSYLLELWMKVVEGVPHQRDVDVLYSKWSD